MADLLGKKVAVFLPSGTMCNEIALRVWRANLSFWTRLNPRHAKTSGRHYFGYGQPHRQGYGLCLRFMGVMNASDRLNAHPIRHALAPMRSPRHNAKPFMPIGFVVVTWRRCRASARTHGLGHT